MPQKITDTAQLFCNEETAPSELSFICQNFSTAEGKHNDSMNILYKKMI